MGKIFKPALRSDAARRVAEQLLEGLAVHGELLRVQVDAHAEHGQVIRVSMGSTTGAERERLAAAVHQRLNPLTIRHEVV